MTRDARRIPMKAQGPVPVPASQPARSLRVEPDGVTVALRPGQSLLEAALAAGVDLPRSCRNGTCRTCRAWLDAGQVRYRVDWPGVTREERAEGWTLPCVAEPASDVVVLRRPGPHDA
ncbi:MAG: 2Fe-2S iron-sulfur cluster-binding protein [Ideonella sp.]|jgi:ferredoxin|nr:2Fe-2S iron-sulfur cluster-binding protein [Ideonella sp.]